MAGRKRRPNFMKVSKAQKKVLLLMKEGRHIRHKDYFYGQEVFDESRKKVILYFRRDTFEALLKMDALIPAEMSVSPKYFAINPYFIWL